MFYYPYYSYRFPIHDVPFTGYLPACCPLHYYGVRQHWNRQPPQYPLIDIKHFQQSLTAFQALLKEGSMMIDKLSQSEDMCKKLMEAAQAGNKAEVDLIVKSIGVKAKVTTTYTPSGIQFIIFEESHGESHGFLTLNLKWE